LHLVVEDLQFAHKVHPLISQLPAVAVAVDMAFVAMVAVD
jgi:hypothetical protein